MCPFVYFGDYCVPTYTICSGIGIILSIFVACILLSREAILGDYIYLIILSLIGLAIGAKLFGVISLGITEYLNNGTISFERIIKEAGSVYYGGLIGLLISLLILCKVKNKQFRSVSSVMAVSIPLFHSIGRIGCYLGGCCYGKETNGFLGIEYRIYGTTKIVTRYPVQLYESAFEFFLFITLLILYNKFKKARGFLLQVYLISYSAFRFFIEFIRGDEVRGIWSLLSFSQYISIGIIFITILLSLVRRKEV